MGISQVLMATMINGDMYVRKDDLVAWFEFSRDMNDGDAVIMFQAIIERIEGIRVMTKEESDTYNDMS